MKTKVFPGSLGQCGEPEWLFTTSFESPIVTNKSGLAMPGGKVQLKEHAFHAL